MDQRRQDFDPGLPEDFDSAHALFAQLRSECPVAWTGELGGFWALTRYDDVRRAASESETFVTSVQNVIPKVAFTGRRPPLHLDPPDHTPYRRTLNPLLSPARVAQFEAVARRYARGLLEPLLAQGGGDICGEYASYLPVQVFGEWMNVPDHWIEPLHRSGRAFILAVNMNDPAAMKATSLKLYEMARELIAIRKAEPKDPASDVTSALLAAEYKGAPLPEELVVGMVRQVLVVGIVAPTVTIGSIGVHLARDRALQDELRADPAKIPAAVEEFLRLYTPYRGFARTATCPVSFGGRTIPAGEAIALVYASANRDDAVFADGGTFVLDRPNIAEHLAFGRGPHNCPGIHLGRMEVRVMLEELLAATAGFELAGPIEPARWPEIGAIAVPLRFL
ncbi:MAG: cytochrome P450 [Sphingomonadales bacterium]|nr:cytochrome P450 [Sphingomonadales bacterium]